MYINYITACAMIVFITVWIGPPCCCIVTFHISAEMSTTVHFTTMPSIQYEQHDTTEFWSQKSHNLMDTSIKFVQHLTQILSLIITIKNRSAQTGLSSVNNSPTDIKLLPLVPTVVVVVVLFCSMKKLNWTGTSLSTNQLFTNKSGRVRIGCYGYGFGYICC